jgi:hypothetical protein
VSRDLPCVYRAATLEEADAFALWLTEQGLEAFVQDRYSVGTLAVPTIAAPRGVEVCVADEATAERARALVQDYLAARESRREAAVGQAPISLTCPACGRPVTFTAERRGQVERCPHCGAFVDVPDTGPSE